MFDGLVASCLHCVAAAMFAHAVSPFSRAVALRNSGIARVFGAGSCHGNQALLAPGLARHGIRCIADWLPKLGTTTNGHKIKAPGVPYKIYHPSIQEPEAKVKITGSLQGPAKFIPKDFRHQQYIDAIRSGEYLGEDWPYNFLSGPFWKGRRYNATYNPIPADSSIYPGVHFFYRLNVWACEWTENGKQRVRWFRAGFGFNRGREAAEDFRRRLVEAGRVDNRRTERQIRLQHLAGQARRNLFKKKFAVKDARRKGNSGTKLGPEWRARKDYKKRGLLP